MKIVNRTQFLALPPGTVYMNYNYGLFGDLSLKGDTMALDSGSAGDFHTVNLTGAVEANDSGDYHDRLMAMEQGASFPAEFDSYGRDGMFDPDQLFAVYEYNDVTLLIEALGGVRP